MVIYLFCYLMQATLSGVIVSTSLLLHFDGSSLVLQYEVKDEIKKQLNTDYANVCEWLINRQ